MRPDDAIFGLPEVSVGLIPGAGGVTRLPKLVGAGRARELMFERDRVDAVEAERIGLVELVVPLDALGETSARNLAGTIAAHAPLAMRALERALRSSEGLPIAEATEAVLPMTKAPAGWTDSRDYLEGMLTAFKEKAPPTARCIQRWGSKKLLQLHCAGGTGLKGDVAALTGSATLLH